MDQDRNSYYRSEYKKEREYQKKKSEIAARRRRTLIRQAAVLGAVLFFVCLYLGDYLLDQTRMPHRLSIYGVSVSGMTKENAAQKLERVFGETELVFVENGEELYRTTFAEAGFSLDGDALREELAEVQSSLLAERGLIEKKRDIEIEYSVLTDEEMLSAALSADHFVVDLERTDSSDAYLEYDAEAGEFVIVSSWQGNVIDEENLRAVLSEAMAESFETGLFEESVTVKIDVNSYQTVTVTENSQELNEKLEQLNQSLTNYQNTSIVYTFGSETEALDSDTICSWLEITDDGVEMDTSLIWTYIDELSAKYNTKYNTRSFTTTAGDTVTLENNEYGYWIDKDAEYTQLCEDLESGTQVEREPVYSDSGLGREGTDDLAGSYIEVSLDKQHLWLYKDYALVIETDIVSGKPVEERETLQGAFSIAYKASPYTLSSEYYGYETDVTYWMPFANGQGLHDATWRSSFGGTRYITNGSHGCINLPLAAAETIYNTITAGYPIIIYSRE
ncbi:MAG: L,D-transpeptidase/peptidoglycan binding protein [Lachnospiraceae bacterium]|nr:L,D-transpeptidase/peptidoglycan binding protein [Lachnospiraceae bacterium]